MSLPLEPTLNSSRGRYQLSELCLASTSESVCKNPHNTMYDEEGLDKPKTCGGRVQIKMDRFRSFVGRSCCSCVEKMPAIVLIIVICLIVAMLLALIPALFILTNSASNEAQAQLGDSHLVFRTGVPLRGNEVVLDGDEDPNARYFSISHVFPPNVSVCPGFGFSCASDPHVVIGTARRCDGFVDCDDGSDEANCQECQTSYSCPMKPSSSGSRFKICLRASQVCDSIKHCPDGSDEKLLCGRTCTDQEISCTSYNGSSICVPNSAKCDGIKDCKDGIDEEKCDECVNGARICKATGKCIDARFVCDSVNHCKDGSDEEGCDCRECSGTTKVLCDDGTCIDRWKICDGHKDCLNGFDEQNCPGECEFGEAPEPTVTCNDGKAYTVKEACSGNYPRCWGKCPECDESVAFLCKDQKCIARSSVCDGRNDCDGGEDEQNCACTDIDFKCKSRKQCVESSRVCDGVQDCSDNSDETNCDVCPEGSLRCELDDTCFSALARCDGVANCSDGSDEQDCSCYECTGMHSHTYMCEGSKRCLKRDEVCGPYTQCPNATVADKLFCANLALKQNMIL